MGKDNSTKGELENDIQAVSVSHATGETLQRLAGQRGTISAFMPVCAMAPPAVTSCSSLCTLFCPADWMLLGNACPPWARAPAPLLNCRVLP